MSLSVVVGKPDPCQLAGQLACSSCDIEYERFPRGGGVAPAQEPRPDGRDSAAHHTDELLEAQIQRIASVIHDDAGQLLALVHLRLEEAVSRLPLECNSSFDGVRALLGQLETQLRCVSHELRPTILDDLGLIPAVEFLAQGFSQRTGVTVDLTSSLFANRRMGCSTEMALYRAVHEALINIGRYARASRVKICFRTIGRRVRCVIWDNGIGFDMKAKRKRGLGIVSMQERVEGLGGQFAIHSQPGQGTEVVITLPLSST